MLAWQEGSIGRDSLARHIVPGTDTVGQLQGGALQDPQEPTVFESAAEAAGLWTEWLRVRGSDQGQSGWW